VNAVFLSWGEPADAQPDGHNVRPGRRTYGLADGSEPELEVSVAEVEFMGDVVGATVIFGEEDCEPILGVTALESAGIEVDPASQRLKRLPAGRLEKPRIR